jgi:hypothetical protein
MTDAAQALLYAVARNNALWCDAVCRAHGLPTALRETLWCCLRPAPPFYPNAVTLAPTVRAADLDGLEGLPGAWALKDSFAALDLEPLGFHVLFAADWIARAPAPVVGAIDPALHWIAVETDDALARWEAAWGEGETPPGAPRLFLPALLAEPGVRFLAGQRGQAAARRTVAGAILNWTGRSTDAVVGVSNVFAAAGEDPAACWRSLVAAAGRLYPGATLVGYEHGPALASVQAAGFLPLHPLRVWGRALPL